MVSYVKTLTPVMQEEQERCVEMVIYAKLMLFSGNGVNYARVTLLGAFMHAHAWQPVGCGVQPSTGSRLQE